MPKEQHLTNVVAVKSHTAATVGDKPEGQRRVIRNDITQTHVRTHTHTHSGLRHCISVQEASLQYLFRIQAASHPAVIESPIGLRIIGPASSRFGLGRPTL